MHTFNPSTPEGKQADLWEFEVNLFYRASSRTGSTATQRNLVLKPPTSKQTQPKDR